MKKILAFMLLPLCACVCGGEEMRFITTLSSPVGTFAQLETADPQYYTEAPVVNYCNTWVSSGKMTLAGANAYVGQLKLLPGVTLGGNVPEYRVSGSSGIVMHGGGRITGGRLMANKVAFTTMGQSKSNVENTLYVPSASFRGVKATNLTIPGKVQTTNQGNGKTLEWSNEYPCTYGVSSSEPTDEVDSVSYGEWKQGTELQETCNSNAYEAFTVTTDSIRSSSSLGFSDTHCTDCRVVDYYSTELGNDGLWDDLPAGYSEDQQWVYVSLYGQETWRYPSKIAFNDFVLSMLKNDSAGGDLSDFLTTLIRCDSNNYLPTTYQSNDYRRWMAYKQYFRTATFPSHRVYYEFRCYFVAAKVQCRDINWTYKTNTNEETKCTGSETEFANSYLLKSR